MAIPTDKIRILHVTPWYPTPESSFTGIWIKRHIELLEDKFENYVIHIVIDWGKWSKKIVRTDRCTSITFRMPWKIWRLREYLFYRLLKSELTHLKKTKDFDLVNFHIAYPACLFLDSLARSLPEKKIITEHWSAYHYNFHSQSNLSRIKNIFRRGIPIVCVSESLNQDIVRFSGVQQEVTIIPNQIDEHIFFHAKKERKRFYFMAAIWAFPKKPFEVLEEWKNNPQRTSLPDLHIAGSGPLWQDMVDFVQTNHLEDQVKLLGRLNSAEIASELNLAEALLLPTEYETFSVISMEALFCGLPVVTNELTVLKDILNNENGIVRYAKETWIEALSRMPNFSTEKRQRISEQAMDRFNTQKIKQLYESTIDEVCSR